MSDGVISIRLQAACSRQSDALQAAVAELRSSGATPSELASLFANLAVHYGKVSCMSEAAMRGLVRVLWVMHDPPAEYLYAGGGLP